MPIDQCTGAADPDVVAGTASMLAAGNTTSKCRRRPAAAGKAISKSADQNKGY